MNNQAKMIIITSNEDLIEQISLNKSENTRIIDLDQNKTNSSMMINDNNNSIDLNLIAQISEFNSNNDQMYKRVLNTPRTHRPKISKTSKKGLDLLCVICEDAAIGFNYDVLTCASCKAFFRRNAQYNPEKLRCLTGKKNCQISHEIHRKCQRCRLTKCLLMGMRRDFILSEEEKQRRRQRIEENRQLSIISNSSMEYYPPSTDNNYTSESIDEIDRLLMDTENDNITYEETNSVRSTSSEGLSIEDWSDIENIRSTYLMIFDNVNIHYRSYDAPDRISALVSWSEVVSERSIKLINFFRQIEAFENLNSEDRFILIKYNLFPLYVIQRSFYFDRIAGKFTNGHNESIDPLKRREFFTLCYGSREIPDRFRTLMFSLTEVIDQDTTLMYLLLIVLLFTKGLSMSEEEPQLNDQPSVNRAQNHYIRLTWNYLSYKQGERKSSQQFVKLMGQIGKLQSYTKSVRQYVHTQSQTTDVLDRLAPLMQTVLNIS